jgi:hypothetical protein
MDLLALSTKTKSNQGEFLHLKHPGTWLPLYDGVDEKGEPDESKPVGLYLLGVDSDVVQKSRHARINSQIASKKPKKVVESENFSEQSEAEKNQILVECTKGWANLSLDGSSEFSAERILQVYSDPGWAWLRAQAIAFVDDRGNFI